MDQVGWKKEQEALWGHTGHQQPCRGERSLKGEAAAAAPCHSPAATLPPSPRPLPLCSLRSSLRTWMCRRSLWSRRCRQGGANKRCCCLLLLAAVPAAGRGGGACPASGACSWLLGAMGCVQQRRRRRQRHRAPTFLRRRGSFFLPPCRTRRCCRRPRTTSPPWCSRRGFRLVFCLSKLPSLLFSHGCGLPPPRCPGSAAPLPAARVLARARPAPPAASFLLTNPPPPCSPQVADEHGLETGFALPQAAAAKAPAQAAAAPEADLTQRLAELRGGK